MPSQLPNLRKIKQGYYGSKTDRSAISKYCISSTFYRNTLNYCQHAEVNLALLNKTGFTFWKFVPTETGAGQIHSHPGIFPHLDIKQQLSISITEATTQAWL